MLLALVVIKGAGGLIARDFTLASNVTEQKMQELIIVAVLLGILLIAVVVSWISGRSSGRDEQMLQDALGHQEKAMIIMLKHRDLDKELEALENEIKCRADEPLTQEAVDKLLKKYKKLN